MAEESHTYDFKVTMTCGGCSGAVERALKKLEGIKDIDVSLQNGTAHVVTAEDVTYATVLDKIKKTGKTVTEAKADGVVQPI